MSFYDVKFLNCSYEGLRTKERKEAKNMKDGENSENKAHQVLLATCQMRNHSPNTYKNFKEDQQGKEQNEDFPNLSVRRGNNVKNGKNFVNEVRTSD